MGARLFKRKVKVTIAKPVKNGERFAYFATLPNAVEIEDLRVTFQIVKTLPSEPNTCQITIVNLSENTRQELNERPLKIILDAGYDGDAQQLFTGDLTWNTSQREGTDWNSILQCGDGERAYKHARVRRSFQPGQAIKGVLKDVTASMGLRIPKSIADAKELTGQLVSGVTVNGPSHAELTRMLQSRGFGWSVQDGQLQILRRNGTLERPAVVVSKDTGLIGSPSFTAPVENKKAAGLDFTMLLNADLRPGGIVQVDSKVARGIYRIQKVTHTGDTHGSDWTSNVEALPIL